MKAVDFIMEAIYPVILIGAVLLFTVLVPYVLYVESECLGKGYQESGASYTLQGYCVSVEGGSKTVHKLGGE